MCAQVNFDNSGISTVSGAISIAGSTTAPGKLRINGQPVAVSDGKFSVPVYLKIGENEIPYEFESDSGSKSAGVFRAYRMTQEDYAAHQAAELSAKTAAEYQDYSHQMQHGLKLYQRQGNGQFNYMGSMECWVEGSDPVMISLKSATGQFLQLDRMKLSMDRNVAFRKDDPAKNAEIYACK